MPKSIMTQVEDWEVVYRAKGHLAAQIIQGRLETAGIPAVLYHKVTTHSCYSGAVFEFIMVPPKRLFEARQLLGVNVEPAEDEEDDW